MTAKRAECHRLSSPLRTVCSSGTGRRRSIGRPRQMVSKSNQMDPRSSFPLPQSRKEVSLFDYFSPFFCSNTNSRVPVRVLNEVTGRPSSLQLCLHLLASLPSTIFSFSFSSFLFPLDSTSLWALRFCSPFFPANRYTLAVSIVHCSGLSWQPLSSLLN